MNLIFVAAIAVLVAGNIAAAADTAEIRNAASIPRFSAAQPGPPPAPWEVVKVNEKKKLTAYDLVEDSGKVVLHAVSQGSASALGVPTRIDVAKTPMIAWRWKVAGLIPGADHAVASKEDAPARLMLTFDGDKGKLSLTDRTTIRIVSQLYGRDLPYATLMYVWSNDLPVGTVIANPHTKRIRMLVASSGKSGVGAWQSLERNLRDDYRKAFGEEPGLLTSIAAFTDSDNTGSRAEAWYGDIALTAKQKRTTRPHGDAGTNGRACRACRPGAALRQHPAS